MCNIGEKTVTLKISGHSRRASIMLSCSATGHEFPAFEICMEVRNGGLSRWSGILGWSGWETAH